MKDPYLIPGQVCEVWDGPYKPDNPQVERFFKISGSGFFIGSMFGENNCPWENYRPHGTEWDYAPDWAVCSTVDACGDLKFWEDTPKIRVCLWEYGKATKKKDCGVCPDKTRYQGDTWKTSLRMRPDWAKVEK